MMLKKAMVLKREMWEKEKAEEEARWAEEILRARKVGFTAEQERKIDEDFKRRASELLTQERKRKREEEGKTGAE